MDTLARLIYHWQLLPQIDLRYTPNATDIFAALPYVEADEAKMLHVEGDKNDP